MGNFFKKALPVLAGAAAGGISNQFSALKPFSAAISAGAGALTNSKNRLAGAAQGFAGGGIGSALTGGVQGMMKGGTNGALDQFGSGAMSGLKTYGNSIPGFGGVGTSNPTGAMAKFFAPKSVGNTVSSSNNSNMRGTLAAFGGGTAPNDAGLDVPNALSYKSTASTGAPAAAKTGINVAPVVDKAGAGGMGRAIAGAGVSLLGGFLTPEVKAPDYSSVTDPLKARVLNGTEGSNAAHDAYMKTLKQPIGADAADARAVNALRNARMKADLDRSMGLQFQAALPNSNWSNSSAYKDAMLQSDRDYLATESAQNAQIQFEYDNQQRLNIMAAAEALGGRENEQVQALASLANADIAEIQYKTGMDVAKAEKVQEMAAAAGKIIANGGVA